MDITMFLAQLWGPAILAVGLGVFVSRAHYIRVYRDLEQNAMSAFVFGMVAMSIGIAQVLFHNVWDTLPQIVVSILGWGILIKGAVFLIVPGFADKAGDTWANLKLVPAAGILMLVIGAYLCWIGYLA